MLPLCLKAFSHFSFFPFVVFVISLMYLSSWTGSVLLTFNVMPSRAIRLFCIWIKHDQINDSCQLIYGGYFGFIFETDFQHSCHFSIPFWRRCKSCNYRCKQAMTQAWARPIKLDLSRGSAQDSAPLAWYLYLKYRYTFK